MKLCVLASGSKGNAIYLESNGSAIVVDQGLAHKTFLSRLLERSLDPGLIRGILVSHEHSDHIGGVGVTARSLAIPIYATAGTIFGMDGVLNGTEPLVTVESGVSFSMGPFEIHPFSVPHDAKEPVQFIICSGRLKIAIATDIGFASTLVIERIRESDVIILESNYDHDMLIKSSYTWQLKQRIMGKTGHLSNRNASELVFNLGHVSPKVILAHLSEENNHPDIAERTIRELFDKYDRPLELLAIANQHTATSVFEL